MLEISTGGYGHASTCLRRYYYSQVEKLVPKPRDIPTRMRRGIWVHRALQDYHAGKDWTDALAGVRKYAVDNDLDTAQIDEVVTDVTDMMTGYVEFYKDKPQWECLTAEEPFYLDIPSADLRLRATVDLVAADHKGDQWVVEHKSTVEIPTQNWRSCDPQTAIQYLLVERSRRFPQLRGITFNYMVTSIPKPPKVVGMKEKNGPRFSETSAQTTSGAFEKGWRELYDVWKGNFGEAMTYHDDWEKRLVCDSAFYQRYDVFKPKELVMGILTDVRETVWAIRRAEETGIWRRAFHQVSCPRFCTYERICSEETLNGKPAYGLRDELFVKDTGVREGR